MIGSPALLGLALGGMLCACSSDSESARVATLLYRIVTDSAPKVTREQAGAVPFATMGVALGSGPQVLLTLGGRSGDQLNWYGGQQIFVSTRRNRVVRTAGLPYDLGRSQELSARDDSGATIERFELDFPDLGLFGAIAECTNSDGGEATVEILGAALQTRRTIEHCNVPIMRWRFDNEFWADNTGFVWRSSQHVHPELDPVVLEVLRPVSDEP